MGKIAQISTSKKQNPGALRGAVFLAFFFFFGFVCGGFVCVSVCVFFFLEI